MTQVFDEDGQVHPATVISAGPVVVTQIKTEETDRYSAVQVGYGEAKEKNISNAQKGHLKNLGFFKILREFRLKDTSGFSKGDKIDISVFDSGELVSVTATSKGKGFQGVVKRHNFAGGRRSHGNKHHERAPGSIGSTGPQRVFKGTRMAGRMGSDTVTVKNLRILQVNPETNTIVLKGAVPGKRGTIVEIKSAK